MRERGKGRGKGERRGDGRKAEEEGGGVSDRGVGGRKGIASSNHHPPYWCMM